jgi:hypothetical protein
MATPASMLPMPKDASLIACAELATTSNARVAASKGTPRILARLGLVVDLSDGIGECPVVGDGHEEPVGGVHQAHPGREQDR